MRILIILLLSVSSMLGQELSIKVAGACGMCQDRIESTALNVVGVNSASYDLDRQILTITYNEVLFDEMDLHNKLAKVGHRTDKASPSPEVYASLPMCCQYFTDDDTYLYGMVFEKVGNGKEAMIGANVYWSGTSNGTSTDMDGGFKLMKGENDNQLVVSYVGYENDTIKVDKAGEVEILLDRSVVLDGIEIVYRNTGTKFSFIDPLKVKEINRKELTKAACCNLSESFETNPSVDVSFTDAITGTRQIEMLGLSGPYVQITREGMPDIRGLAALDGFSFIPGTWIEGMQMNLGTGSVINGYESVAGQINVELKKPHDEELLHINGYANLMGRYEGNVVSNFGVTEKVRSSLMLHYSALTGQADNNNDRFLDNPNNQSIIIGNRWKYQGDNGHEGELTLKSTIVDREAGTLSDNPLGQRWNSVSDIVKHDVSIKRGVIFKNRPNMSVGLMLNGTYNDVSSLYGNRQYDANQRLLYGNLIFVNNLPNTNHKLSTGVSFLGEEYDESFSDYDFERAEYVPGVFGEYAYKVEEKFDAVVGLRVDRHNNYGLFVTPRLHLRYALDQQNVLRVAVGRGQRTANVFAENIGAMASNRKWIIDSEVDGNPYGLSPEVAWSYGVNYTFVPEKTGAPTFGVDYFFTNFSNQIVTDYDQNPQEFHVYNLDGRSYAHSVQGQIDFSMFKKIDVRLAYRYNDVQTDYKSGRRWKPLSSRHRTFANLAYETDNGWQFDYTVNLIGQKRLPDTKSNPIDVRNREYSPVYTLQNAQITKQFGNFAFYVGGENIGNFRQEDAILSANDPQSPFFDASMVWGPIFGANVYGGFRYIITKDE